MTQDEKLIDDLSKEAESLGIAIPEKDAEEKVEAEPETLKEEKPAEETKPEEAPEKEEESDEEEKPHRSKVVPYESHRELKQKYRELKQQLADATTQKEVDAISDEINEIAKEAQADPKVIQKIVDLARRESKPLKEEMPDGDESEEEESEDKAVVIDPVAEKQYFDKEWSDVLPSLQEKYPDASESQLKEAKKIIDQESHKATFRDKELDYVIFKTTEKLDELLASPKKKGLEVRTPGVRHEESDGKIKSFDEMSGDDIRALDSKLKGIEMSQSSLKLSKR